MVFSTKELRKPVKKFVRGPLVPEKMALKVFFFDLKKIQFL